MSFVKTLENELRTAALVMLIAIGIRLGEMAKRLRARSLNQVGKFMPCQNRGAQKGYGCGLAWAAGAGAAVRRSAATCIGGGSSARESCITIATLLVLARTRAVVELQFVERLSFRNGELLR